jgi:REP element-mobilizing transposase RayT
MNLRTHPSGWHHRGYLPHIDTLLAWQSVTFRLWDSLSQAVLARVDAALVQMPEDTRCDERLCRIHALLDDGLGSCLLRDHADLVRDIILDGDGRDYRIGAWVVMPNHVHLLVGPPAGGERIALAALMQRWKGASARAINTCRGSTGRIWQPDYFDRIIRDQDHATQVVDYILDNPVSAGLAKARGEWAWCGVSNR